MTSLSPAAAALLERLRSNVEDSIDGWGTVYLDNVRGNLKPHEFAGYLSALEAAGLYRPDTNEYAGEFGYVKEA